MEGKRWSKSSASRCEEEEDQGSLQVSSEERSGERGLGRSVV